MLNRKQLAAKAQEGFEKSLEHPEFMGYLPFPTMVWFEKTFGSPLKSEEEFFVEVLKILKEFTNFFEIPKRDIKLACGISHATRYRYRDLLDGKTPMSERGRLRKSLRTLMACVAKTPESSVEKNALWWSILHSGAPELIPLHFKMEDFFVAKKATIEETDYQGTPTAFYAVNTVHTWHWLCRIVASDKDWSNYQRTRDGGLHIFNVFDTLMKMLRKTSCDTQREARLRLTHYFKARFID